jgi:hypothetical protein
MAEWYNFSGNIVNDYAPEDDAIAIVNPDQYRCNCGCNLDFIDYEPGFDVYIGNNWIVTANALVKYSWSDYICPHEFKVWQELREDIILNYNHTLNNDPMIAEDAPWVHLYNVNVAGNVHIPLNENLYYE